LDSGVHRLLGGFALMEVMGQYVDAGDVDLDGEAVRRQGGSRITEAQAAEQGERIARRGRPSLTGKARTSPQIGVRLSPDLNNRLTARATREGKKPSEVVREALEHYV
jgi:predicted HicB family RNase H-like nuclease